MSERATLWRETFLRVLDHELEMVRQNRGRAADYRGTEADAAREAAMAAADTVVARCPAEGE